MNRGEWRTKILDQRSWNADVDDPAFKSEVNRLLDTAIKRLASEVPGAFVPDVEKVVLFPDRTDVSLGRKIAVTTDPKVLTLGLDALAGASAVITDGTWDGVYHLEVKDTSGRWHRRVCREFWLETGAGPYQNHYLVSIDRPWQNTTDANLTFRMHQPEVFTADDVMEVLDGKVWDENGERLQVLPENYAHMVDDVDFQGNRTGRPLYIYRSRHMQLDAPNRAPSAALAAAPIGGGGGTPWAGPEPTGTFTYVITYVWGRRDPENQDPDGNGDPMWESSPSPASSAVIVPDTVSAVVLTLPEIDWQLNFNVTGSIRASHSGLRKRIYRARRTVTGTAPLKVTIESPDVYQFLAEVDGAATSYTDNGVVVPGYFRRLPESHGYYAWKVAPHQDDRYEVDLRVRRLPRKLENDYDAPRVHPAAEAMLIELGLHYLCRAEKAPEDALVHLEEYRRLAEDFRGQFANAARVIPPTSWSPTGTGSKVTYDPFRYSRFTS